MSSPPKFWQGLAEAMEQPTLFDDPRFADRNARIDHQEDLIELMGGIFKKHPREEWCNRLRELEVPHAAMYTSDEVMQDPQSRHLQLLVEAEHPSEGLFKTIRPPISFDGERNLEVTAPPVLGEHNEQVRAELAARKQSC